ncbi:WD repeat-containing protein [Acrasis kona]|uniref:WD repeat-containing protein n=1 Tax=Acrasis kona TaxID=1008807 RepID=A0AAW2YGW6_9EUKA
MEYWKYLETKFFSKLDQSFVESIRKLELSIKKYYVVNCIQSGRVDRCREFFDNYANELAKDKEWRDWFVLPFLKYPEVQPELEPYFNKTWAEMLYVSLQNFISTALRSVDKPKLLTFESDKRERNSALISKLDALTMENGSLTSKLLSAQSYILKLQNEAGVNPSTVEAPITSPSQEEKVYINDDHFNFYSGGHEQHKTEKKFPDHKDLITKCAFSGDGLHLASSSRDKTVRVWSMKDNVYHQCFDCGALPLCIDWNKKNDQLLFSKCTGEFSAEPGFSRVNDVSNCPSNSHYCVVSASNSATSEDRKGSLFGYNLKSNKVDHKFHIAAEADSASSIVVNAIRFNHNGTMIVTGCSDGYVRVFDVKSQTNLMTWKAHQGQVTSAHFSSNETTILTTGDDHIVHQWSAHKLGNPVQSFNNSQSNQDTPRVDTSWSSVMALSGERSECFVVNSPPTVFSLPLRRPTCTLQWSVDPFTDPNPRLGSVDWHGSNMIAASYCNLLYLFNTD